MTLTEKLDAVMREQSLLPNTRSCYHAWVIYLHADAARGVSPLDIGARPVAAQPFAGFLS